jgi:hypothetical protein
LDFEVFFFGTAMIVLQIGAVQRVGGLAGVVKPNGCAVGSAGIADPTAWRLGSRRRPEDIEISPTRVRFGHTRTRCIVAVDPTPWAQPFTALIANRRERKIENDCVVDQQTQVDPIADDRVGIFVFDAAGSDFNEALVECNRQVAVDRARTTPALALPGGVHCSPSQQGTIGTWLEIDLAMRLGIAGNRATTRGGRELVVRVGQADEHLMDLVPGVAA